ncbi:MAG TPA: DMT family transporter [Candidatus Thioglobus sp.]|nr:DMT family transporter [Candidatus Thioglobus sp.]HIL43161.1 DMT family transporter [Gammaproteobacteria bacterium]
MNFNKFLPLLMIIAMFLWASSFVSAKVLALYINEHELVTYRYLITTLTMVPVLWALKIPFKIDIMSFIIATISAIFLVAYTKLFFLGTDASTANFSGALITTLMPIIVYVILIFSGKKRPKTKDWLALLIGIVGVSIMINIWQFKFDEVLNAATLLLVWAAFSFALLSISTSYNEKVNPLSFSFYIYLVATLLNSIFFFDIVNGSILVMDKYFWFNMMLMSVGSTTFATTIYFFGMQKLGAKATVYTFLVPFFVILLGVIFLGESIHISTVIGSTITIIALLVINNVKLSDFRL